MLDPPIFPLLNHPILTQKMHRPLLQPALALTSYPPFGVVLEGRSWSAGSGYRYGFNGKEKDDEGMGGGGQTYDYGFRIYNPGLAKFLSVDPLFKGYPWLTPYQFASNRPIVAIDIDGLEAGTATGADNVTSDPNEIEPAMTFAGRESFSTVEIAGELSGWQKFKAFGESFVAAAVTTAVAVVAVAAIAATCGAAGPFVVAAAVSYGAAVATEEIVELSTGKEDWGTGRELTQYETYSKWGGLYGGIAGGGLSIKLGIPLGGGKSRAALRPEIPEFGIDVMSENISIVKQHLERFGNRPENEIMLRDLDLINKGEIQSTEIHENFMRHELREAELMKNDMEYEDAHYQTLQEQGMYERGYEEKLYTKEALDAGDAALRKE
jgi:RHS repeat-associated protein